MKNTFGATNCHLLQINSRPQGSVEKFLAEEGNNLPDPWAHFLARNLTLNAYSGLTGSNAGLNAGNCAVGTPNGFVESDNRKFGSEVDLAGLPSKVTEMNNAKSESLSHGDSVVDLAVEMVEEDPNDSIVEVNGKVGGGETGEVVNHPLSSPGPQTDDEEEKIVGSGLLEIFGVISYGSIWLGVRHWWAPPLLPFPPPPFPYCL